MTTVNTIKNEVSKVSNEASRAVERTVNAGYPEIDNIREDLSSLKSNVGGLARHAYENGRENFSHLGEKAGNSFDRLRDYSNEEMHRLEDRVRAQPGKSMAIAFGIGVLAALFMRK